MDVLIAQEKNKFKASIKDFVIKQMPADLNALIHKSYNIF